ncbi:MAG: bifunctional metallophosphatase/5'-nucleotidase [Candidatus Competibacteraceae bacterium]|nr:bifunctional metallophosphatase/5'-nucleotidase [Candidatus Competibacteraceae bacterium]
MNGPNLMYSWQRLLPILLLSMILVACGGDDDNNNLRLTPPPTTFQLQLLHAADMEGGAEAVEDAPRFSAILNALRDENPTNTLVLSSGDAWIPGPLYSASSDDSLSGLLGIVGNGRGDILMQNAMGFQASAFGNHEFDEGPDAVFNILAADSDDTGNYPGAAFPYLSVNLDFSAEPELSTLVTVDGQNVADLANRIARSAVVTVAGETIGLVGATTPALASISSTGDVIVNPANGSIPELANLIQAAVDALTATGIDKIIILTHMQQLAIEQQLAGLLDGVDIIIGGGSDSILADATDRLRPGDIAVDDYPIQLTSASGEPVLLVNTDGQYRYIGRLVVEFDANGVVLPDSIDTAVSGAYATDEQGLIELNGPNPDPTVVAIAGALGEVLIDRESNTFGKTLVYLNGVRASVRTEETNLGNLTADANLFVAQSFDPSTALSIKNGGGIRNDIGEVLLPPGTNDPDDAIRLPPPANPIAGKEEGQISQFDIQDSLRFNNDLTLLTLTAAELVAVIEHGVAATEPGATPGQFSQVGGIRFSFDPSLPPNSRVRSLLVLDSNGAQEGVNPDVVVQDGLLQGDPGRLFRIVTLGFLAGGGDQYPFPDRERVDLVEQGLPMGAATFADPGSEQDALAEYLVVNFPDGMPFDEIDTPIEQDERIQNLNVRADTVLTP